MHIGNRIFPYPVLNKNSAFSDYTQESIFKVEFDFDENGLPVVQDGELIFKNLHFVLTDTDLISLLNLGKLKCAFIVECSASVYRKNFNITLTPQDLRIPTNEINGNVVASCYLYAAEGINNFKSSGFISEYSGYSFDIDKFDIIAVDDGFTFTVDMDPSLDDRVASIFLIVKKEDTSPLLTYENKDKNIVLYLSPEYYDAYDNIKSRTTCNNISFSLLAIPVLAICLDELCSSQDSTTCFSEILEDHSWFNAVLMRYEKINGTELTYDEFCSMNKLELAQSVMNNASCKGLKDFDNMLLSGMDNLEGGNESDE